MTKNQFWRTLTLSDRIELINEQEGNIFAARHNTITTNANPHGLMLEKQERIEYLALN